MAKYQIACDNTVLGRFGEVVSDEQLAGCNVAALLAGGALVPAVDPKPNLAEKATSKKE